MKNSSSLSSAFIFKFIERFGTQLLTFVLNIILARLLLPSDFGAVAIINVFVILAQTISQNGVTSSLIQKKKLSDFDFSTGFDVSFILVVFLYAILFCLSPVIETYYGISDLSLYLRIVSLSLFPQCFISIYNSILMRNMKFKGIMISGMSASILSCLTGVLLAYNGFGIWSLITMQLLSSIIQCISLSIFAKWKISLKFSKDCFLSMIGFGSKVVAAAIVDNLYYDVENLLIGKQISDENLGYYSNAKNYPLRVISSVKETIVSVLFPALSKNQKDHSQFSLVFAKAVSILTFIMFPMMFGFAGIAEEFIHVFLTDKWMECLYPMIFLSIGYAFMAISAPNMQALKALGDSKTYLVLEIIRKSLLIFVLFATVFLFKTPYYIALGSMICTAATALLICFVAGIKIRVDIFKQLGYCWKNILSSFIMLVGILFISSFINGVNPVIVLLIKIASGILIYLLMSLILKNQSFFLVIKKIMNIMRRSVNYEK